MSRTFACLIGCLFLTLMSLGPVHAQQNGELRELLPTVEQGAAEERGTPIEAPLLIAENDELRKATSDMADIDGRPSIRVGSVLIQTDAALDHRIFETAIEPYLGVEATNDELARLAQQIAEIARARGMILASAYVPKQQVELGIVRIVLRPGRIDEVRIEGSSNRYLHRLFKLLARKPLVRAELERRLMLAGEIRRISVEKAEMLNDGDRQILVIKVKQRRKTGGRIVVDNFGSRNIGPFRARLTVEAVALLDDSDSLNVTYRTNPVDPEELVAASVSYGIALNDNGTTAEIATAWSKSKIDPRPGIPQRNAQSQLASIGINHPLRRSRSSNLWLDGQFEYLKIEQESLGAPLRSDTVVTASAGLSSSLKLGNGWLRTGGQLRQGMGMLGANRPGDPLSSRADADGQFTMGRAWANWSGKAVGDVTMRLAVSGQVANKPLLSSEEIGLGGPYIGRAFNFYEKSGDQGVLGLVEIGYELHQPTRWLNRIQPYVFIDGGYVGNLRGGRGGGSLISAGGGVRAEIGKVSLQLEVAKSVYGSGRTDRAGPNVNLQVGFSF